MKIIVDTNINVADLPANERAQLVTETRALLEHCKEVYDGLGDADDCYHRQSLISRTDQGFNQVFEIHDRAWDGNGAPITASE